MTYYYTYKITCLKGSLKDHYYFGQHTTTNLNDGYCGSGIKLQNYYKKYGAEENVTYTKEIIKFYTTPEELNQAEYELIGDKYDSDNMCLNLRAGGDMYGMSDSTKRKISDKLKGNVVSEETRHKLSVSNKGKKRTETTKKRISNSRKGIQFSEEHKNKLSNASKGRPNSMKGKHHSEVSKQHMSDGHLGKHHSENTKNKLSKFFTSKTWYFDEILNKRVWVDKIITN